MDVVIQALIPLFSIILLGYLVGRFKILGMNSAKVLNTFVMKIALPILVFGAVATEPLDVVLNGPFVLAFMLALLIPYILSFVIGHLRCPESISKSALRSLAYSLPNTGYMGIPLMHAIYGKQGVLIASIATFLTVSIILLTIILCEMDQQETKEVKQLVKKTALVCLKNPLMIATALGILYSFLSIPMPTPFHTFVELIGNVAGPCALFALGELIVGQSLQKGPIEISLISIVKLLVQPALALLFLWWFGVDQTWAISGFLLSALPTAVILAVLVDYYQTYLQRGLASILVTTIASIGTLLIVIGVASKIWGPIHP